jgi:hypothetical protein
MTCDLDASTDATDACPAGCAAVAESDGVAASCTGTSTAPRTRPARGTGDRGDTAAWANTDANAANPDPMHFVFPMRGFSASDTYRDNREYTVPLNPVDPPEDPGVSSWRQPGPQGGLGAGSHSMWVKSASNSGWHGGYWEITASGVVVAGGPVDGQVAGCGGDGCEVSFTLTEPPVRPGCECDPEYPQRPGCGTVWDANGRRPRNLDSPRCIVMDPNGCTSRGRVCH